MVGLPRFLGGVKIVSLNGTLKGTDSRRGERRGIYYIIPAGKERDILAEDRNLITQIVIEYDDRARAIEIGDLGPVHTQHEVCRQAVAELRVDVVGTDHALGEHRPDVRVLVRSARAAEHRDRSRAVEFLGLFDRVGRAVECVRPRHLAPGIEVDAVEYVIEEGIVCLVRAPGKDIHAAVAPDQEDARRARHEGERVLVDVDDMGSRAVVAAGQVGERVARRGGLCGLHHHRGRGGCAQAPVVDGGASHR